MKGRILVVLALALLVAGCSDTSDPSSTTSSTVADEINGEEGTGGSDGVGPGGTTTTVHRLAITEYREVHAEETLAGSVLHLVIPRGGYTDIDIEAFIRDLLSSRQGLWDVEIFDNADAQVAFMTAAADRTDDQRTVLARHHLVSLIEGETLVWRGPFSSLGQSTIGS